MRDEARRIAANIAKLPEFFAQGSIAVLFGRNNAALVRSTAMEKHELSKIDFEMIDDAFKALLQSRPDPMTADKIADLRDIFRVGWRLRKRLPRRARSHNYNPDQKKSSVIIRGHPSGSVRSFALFSAASHCSRV